ncbi:MAG: glutathione S-transferase family protein [Caulobacterales bacterium]|nr:glutathione S-transferase family protein [Caulobacterales bacterium]
MTLRLFAHPLSSYCWKVLIPLYEAGTPFTFEMIQFGAGDGPVVEFMQRWPIGKMPLLRDEARNETVVESSIIIEYLDRHYPGAGLIPADPEAALKARFMDRFFDNYVMTPQGRLVFEVIRPEGAKDPFGVADARRTLEMAYGYLEATLSDGRTWAAGESYSMADCAASPALFYAQRCQPWGDRPRLQAYYDRLEARPSFARALKEAQPYMHMFPGGPDY